MTKSKTTRPETTNAAPFKLSVNNFGPIARANVDLRPLSVLIGPNHTGKSYLATLIYALHQTFSKKILYGAQDGVISQSHGEGFLRWSTETTDGILFNWLDNLPPEPELKQEDAKASFHEIVRPVLATYMRALNKEIQRCFGVSLRALIRRRSTRNTTLVLGTHAWGHDLQAFPFETMVTIGKRSPMTPTFSPNMGKVDCDDLLWQRLMVLIRDFKRVEDDRKILWHRMHDLKALLSEIIDPGIPDFFGVLCRPAFYLPASRTGALQAYYAVADSLIERSMQPQTYNGRKSRAPAAGSSGIFLDFVRTLAGLDRKQRQTHRDLADRFEKSIFNGSIVADFPELGLPSYHYRPDGWKSPLHLSNTSSIVSQLAPVAIYLRYFVQKGDLLIIEEPASGMHPNLRTAFVRQLAGIVNAGIRVMITAHDEWIVDELAKLVRSARHPLGQNEADADANAMLTAEQIGAWSFEMRKRPRGTVVGEISIAARSRSERLRAKRGDAVAGGR